MQTHFQAIHAGSECAFLFRSRPPCFLCTICGGFVISVWWRPLHDAVATDSSRAWTAKCKLCVRYKKRGHLQHARKNASCAAASVRRS